MKKASSVIVGAGPGGLGAAVELAQRGVKPIVIDENAKTGGQIYKYPAGQMNSSPLSLPLESYRAGKKLLEEVNSHRGQIEHISSASAFGVFENLEVAYTKEGTAQSLQADTLLLALGAHDRTIPFPGWTRPGVVTVGGLQTLLKHHGVLPGKQIVLAGSGLLSLLVAAQMTSAGFPPVALIEATGLMDLAPAIPPLLGKLSMIREGLHLMRILRQGGVRIMRRQAVVRAYGNDGVEAIDVAPLDSNWKPNFSRIQRLEVDCLAIGYGLVPEVSLTRLAGATFDYRPELGGWVPQYNENMETERENVFVAGDGCGIRGAEIAQMQGRLAGIVMAERINAQSNNQNEPEKEELREKITHSERARTGLEKAFQIRPGIYDTVTEDTHLCRCEEITWAETCEWMERGLTSSTQLKMATRVGMGRCQGRYCGPNIRDLLKRELGNAADLDDNLTARPPVKPVSLETLAEMAEDSD